MVDGRQNWDAPEWAVYVREAQGRSVAAIVETGRRLREAHDAYLREPKKWGRKFVDWCKAELGLSHSAVSQMEAIAEHVNDVNMFPLLPPSWGSLYEISQFAKEDPEEVRRAINEGRISPITTREQIQKLREDYVVGVRREQRFSRIEADARAEERNRYEGVGWAVEQCDFRDWGIAPGSVNMVLTDPPYAEEYVKDYRALAEDAYEWLAPEGWCAVMVGQRHLPKILEALSSGPLEYVWTFGLGSAAGRVTGIQFIQVQSTWKPLVLLRKGKIKLREWTGDWISYGRTANDRGLHKWQQEVSPFQHLIRAMTDPGGDPATAAVIADPFCGSGTTGHAALSCGRKFVGCDEDQVSVDTTVKRLTDWVEESRKDRGDGMAVEAEQVDNVRPFPVAVGDGFAR